MRQPVPAVLEQHLRAAAAQDLDRAGAPERRPRERDDLDDRLVERRRRRPRRPGAARAGAGRRRGAARRARAAAGASDGSQTSQHGPVRRRRAAVAEVAQDAARAGSPSPSTHAQTARYWRQRARVPSCAAERQSASARPSQVPVTRPSDAVGRRRARLDHARRARGGRRSRARPPRRSPRGARAPPRVERRSGRGGRPRRVSARATAFSAGSSTVERSMKNTCRPLSRDDANSRQRAGAPSRPARPASW